MSVYNFVLLLDSILGYVKGSEGTGLALDISILRL